MGARAARVTATQRALPSRSQVPSVLPRSPPSGRVPQAIKRMVAFICPRRRGGQRSWRKGAWLALQAMMPKLVMDRPTAQKSGQARGGQPISTAHGAETVMETQMIRADPARCRSRVALSAPTTPPMAAPA